MNKDVDGVLRCMICGQETRRVSSGLNYGFPKHCGQTMRVITPAELDAEKEFQESVEDEAHFFESAEGRFL